MVILGFVFSLSPSSIREFSPFPYWIQGWKVLTYTLTQTQRGRCCVVCSLLSKPSVVMPSPLLTAGSPWTVAGKVAKVGCPRTRAKVYQSFHIHLTKMYLKSQPITFAVIHGPKSV